MRQYLFMGFCFILGLSLNTWKGEAFGMPIQIERMNPPGPPNRRFTLNWSGQGKPCILPVRLPSTKRES